MISNQQTINGEERRAHRARLHGSQLRTLEAIFRHPIPHNLEWMDVVALMESVGTVIQDSDERFGFRIGSHHYQMRKPHTKHLTGSEVVDLKHFLQSAGCSPELPSQAPAHPEPAAPSLMVVVDQQGAKIYRIHAPSDASRKVELTPYDPPSFPASPGA